MGKQGSPAEAKKQADKPTEAKGGAPAHGATNHAPAPAKGGAGAKIGCLCLGCKDKDMRLGFCDEHFKQFKFGLITKTGEKVLDFEKKFEHYQRWLKSQEISRGRVA